MSNLLEFIRMNFFFRITAILVTYISILSPSVHADTDTHEKKLQEIFLENLKQAETGNIEAQYLTAVNYYKGEGVEKHPQLAYNWFEKAALKGHSNSMFWLAILIFRGETYEKYRKKGEEWLLKASNAGDLSASSLLGRSYYYGINGYRKNCALAKLYLEKASTGEEPLSQRVLGSFYSDNICETPNPELSFKYFERSCVNKNVEACTVLGKNYLLGIHTIPDRPKAIEWLNHAAQMGSKKSLHIIMLFGLQKDSPFNRIKEEVPSDTFSNNK